MSKQLCRVGAVALFVSMVLVPHASMGQELACQVQLDRSQLSGSDFGFLDDLERQIQEYMNTRKWTDDTFQPQERIACTLQLIVTESVTLSEFKAQIIVSSRRPIHGTAQSTVVVRINDSRWRFEYGRGKTLEFDLDEYNALTSVLDFYAYVLLGYDYDTFSELGGTPHFEKARRVASQAQNSGDPGWSTTGAQQNRQQLIRDLLAQRTRPLRKAYYQYHRRGLDRFVKAPEKARTTVFEVVQTLQELDRTVSNSYPLNLFFSTKHEELTAFFQEGERQKQVYNRLTQIDPSHSSSYDKIVQ